MIFVACVPEREAGPGVPAEPGQPVCLPVHLGQVRQGIHQLEADVAARAEVRVERWRQGITRAESVDELHHVEASPDHRLVSAQGERRGMRHRRPIERRQDPELPDHVVRRRRHRDPRGAPEHPVLGPAPETHTGTRRSARIRSN